MKRFWPAVFVAYAAVHLACPWAVAATIIRNPSGVVVSPTHGVSCTFTAKAGSVIVIPALAGFGSLSADAEFCRSPKGSRYNFVMGRNTI